MVNEIVNINSNEWIEKDGIFPYKSANESFILHSQFNYIVSHIRMAARTIALLLLGLTLHVSIDLNANISFNFLICAIHPNFGIG